MSTSSQAPSSSVTRPDGEGPASPLVAAPTRPALFSERSLKQLGLFFAGASFLTASMLVTRRSIRRKTLAAAVAPLRDAKLLKNSSNNTGASVAEMAAKDAGDGAGADGGLIAAEALGLATLNVASFGLMLVGGISWAFDLSSVTDLRTYARRQFGLAGGVEEDQQKADEQIEEWIAETLSRKMRRKGDGEGVAEKK